MAVNEYWEILGNEPIHSSQDTFGQTYTAVAHLACS